MRPLGEFDREITSTQKKAAIKASRSSISTCTLSVFTQQNLLISMHVLVLGEEMVINIKQQEILREQPTF